MRFEYAAFDALVFAPAFAASLVRRPGRGARLGALLFACAAVAVPFVLWDAAVVNRHWWFEPTRVFGARLLGLPLEELGFFLAVPYASVFLWETAFFKGGDGASKRASPKWALLPAGLALAAAVLGREYTACACLAFALAMVLDDAAGTALFGRGRFWLFLLAVSALGLVFNGYLTARPVVLYDPRFLLGPRLFTVPLEDFVYGAALISSVTVLYHWRLRRVGAPSWLGRLVELRLGGYRQRYNTVDGSLPERVARPVSAAVIGGGLAGLSAAALLAGRGLTVTVFEKNPYWGGKLAGWRDTLPTGLDAPIEHGFHAFFRHYYNLNAFLDSHGLRRTFVSVGRYAVVSKDGRVLEFDGADSTPVLNLLALARRGLYSLRQVALGPARKEMEAFLRYDPAATFERFDRLPFSEFARRAQLPPLLKVVFTTFARAFFAHEEDLSTAELIKAFHFYYLSHDRGLVYDYLPGQYQAALVEPLERHLRSLGVELRAGEPVTQLARVEGGLSVNGGRFDRVVVATDLQATQRLMASTPLLRSESPPLAERLAQLKTGSRYAVLRVWLDKPVRARWPVFASVERVGELDAVAFVDRTDPELARWAEASRGCVVELHSYAVSSARASRDQVQASLLEGLTHYLPELRGAAVLHEHLQLRDDFTAFHVGLDHLRPPVDTGVDGLFFAGDWVKLPVPAMLMEAAHTSAVFAANAICGGLGVREYPIETVPVRGVMVKRAPKGP